MEAPRIATATPAARSSYDLSGKSLLTAVLILLSSVLLVLSLHAITRCYLLRRSRSRRRRIPHYFRPPSPVSAADRGLDPAILSSLPVLSFSSSGPDECAVCLCDFDDGDRVRVLPGCSHTFHVECIDMWFFSHSTCPLCRSTIDSSQIIPPDLCVLCRDDEEAPAAPDEAPASNLETVAWNEAVVVDREEDEEEEKALGGLIAAIKSILNWDFGFHCGCGGGDLESGGGEGERQ